MERFDIYLRGFSSSEPAAAGLQRVFGIDRKRASELVRSLPRVVKRDVPGEQAVRYQQALSALGADFELRRSPIRPQPMITVSGGRPLRDELELPGPGWPDPPAQQPARPAAVLAVADSWVEPTRLPAHAAVPVVSVPSAATALEAHDPRSLAGTWSESRPPPRSLGDTLSESRAAPPQPSVQPRPLSITLPESMPPPAPALPPSLSPAAEALSWAHPPELAHSRAPKPMLSAAEPVSLPAPATALSSAWAPIPAAELASATASTAGPPAAWQADALDVSLEQRGQPGWLVENRTAYPQNEYEADVAAAILDPFDPPPSVRAGARAPAGPGAAAAGSAQPAAVALPSARPGRSSNANPVQAGGRPWVPPAVGTVAGRELASDEPSQLLRWVLRVGIGLSLFVILTTVRHIRAFETGVDDALARWGKRSQKEDVRATQAEGNSELGPDALAWLEPDLHLVSSGDKDRARSLAHRFLDAGAAGVFVGTISPMGMTKVAGELIVQLPAEPAARKAVRDVYDEVLANSFQGAALDGAEPEGDLLHVTF